MEQNIIEVINSLADKSDDFFSKGEVEGYEDGRIRAL